MCAKKGAKRCLYFLLLPEFVQLFVIIILLIIEMFSYFCLDVFKVVCCKFVVCENVLKSKKRFMVMFHLFVLISDNHDIISMKVYELDIPEDVSRIF